MGLKRDNKIAQTPGPGDYENALNEEKGFRIGEKRSEKQMEDAPAPGAYELQSTLERKGASIGVKRDDRIPQTPGPGDYEQALKDDKGFKIGERRSDK